MRPGPREEHLCRGDPDSFEVNLERSNRWRDRSANRYRRRNKLNYNCLPGTYAMNSSIICPTCEQGEVLQMRVIDTGEELRVCDECEAVWPAGAPLAVPGFEQLADFLEDRGIPPLWSSLEFVEIQN